VTVTVGSKVKIELNGRRRKAKDEGKESGHGMLTQTERYGKSASSDVITPSWLREDLKDPPQPS